MEEATVTSMGAPAQPQLPEECQMTTDDLVMIAGEAAVQKRQDAKIAAYQTRQINSLVARVQQLMGEQSQMMQKIAALEQGASELQTSRAQDTAHLQATIRDLQADNAAIVAGGAERERVAIASWQARICELEDQVHSVALERDELKKMIAAMNQKKMEPVVDLIVAAAKMEPGVITTVDPPTRKTARKKPVVENQDGGSWS